MLQRCAVNAAARAFAAWRCASSHSAPRAPSSAEGSRQRHEGAPPSSEGHSLDVPEGRLATSTVRYTPGGTAGPAAAEAALCGAWRALTLRLGPHHTPPTAVVLLTSAPAHEAARCAALLSELVAAERGGAAASSSAAGEPPRAPPALLGCTSRPLLPAPAAAEADEGGGPPEGTAAHAARAHITLAAASLPEVAAHTFHASTDSLPALPVPFRELLGARPQLLLLTHPTDQDRSEQASALLQRFERLMPGSALVAALASTTPEAGARREAAAAPAAAAAAAASRGAEGEEATARPWLEEADLRQRRGEGQEERGEDHTAVLPPPRRGGRVRLVTLRGRARGPRGTGAAAAAAPRGRGGGGSDAPAAGGAAEGAAAAGAPLLFLDGEAFPRGSVGMLLVPRSPAHAVSAATGAALVRLLLGGDLLGVCAHYNTRGVYLLPRHDVLAHLQPTPEEAAAHLPPSQHDPRAWRPALPRLRGLERSGDAASAGRGASGAEVAMFALEGLQHNGRVWPGMQLPLRVFERRYQLLVKACLDADRPNSDRGGGGGAFGIVSGGYGTSAAVLVCRVTEDTHHTLIIAAAGRRFRCLPGTARVLPASFGLTAARVEWVEDELPPLGSEEAHRLAAAARGVVTLLRRAAQEQRHQTDTAAAFGGSMLSRYRSGQVLDGIGAAASPLPQDSHSWGQPAAVGDGSEEPPLPVQLVGDDPASLQLSSELSLVLARCMPVSGDTKELWFRSTDALARLEQQFEAMLGSPQACPQAVRVLAQLHLEHPLRGLADALVGTHGVDGDVASRGPW